MPKTEPSADVAVSTIAAIYSQLATWESQGPTSAKVIEFTGTATGELDLDNYIFTNEVTVRGPVPSSPGYYTGHGKWGKISLVNSANITVAYFPAGYVDINNSDYITLRDCEVYGNDTTDPDLATNYGVFVRNGSTYITVEDNTARWFNKGIITQTCNNVTIRGNVFREGFADDIYIDGSCNAMTVEYNWFSRDTRAASDTHCDWIQTAANRTISDITYRGNIGVVGVVTNKGRQAFFDNSNTTNGLWTGNILITNMPHGIESDDDATIGRTDCDILNNTLLRIEGSLGMTGTPKITDENSGTSSGNTYDRNLQCHETLSGTGGTSGANGLYLTIGYADGVPSGLGWDVDATFDVYHPYFEEAQSYTQGFYGLRPKVGARTHWDHVDPLGATDTYERVLSTGLHPGNNNNAASKVWRDAWDPSWQISSGSEEPAAPEITWTPTINGTLTVGATITFTPASVSGVPSPTRTWEVYNTVSGLVQDSAADSYVLQATDEGDGIYVTQREENTEGFATATSTTTDPIGAAVSAPTIVSRSPADNATGVALDSQPYTITFNKNIAFGPSGTVGLYRSGASPELRQTWDIVADRGTGLNQVSISGATLTITNSGVFLDDANYWFQISNGAIEGTDGSVFGGINDSTTWNFTTSDTPASAPKNMARRMLTSITVA